MDTMTPSAGNVGLSDGQIDKATEQFRALLTKHRSDFEPSAAQQAIGAKGLIPDMFAVFRGYVEKFSNLIVLVGPNRNQTPQEVLDATGRKQYTFKSVVASMPKGTGTEAKVVFFKLGRFVSDYDLEKEYESRGLKPADPYSLAKVNEKDPAFADEHPNCTHWKDKDGNWCYAAFNQWDGDERHVHVDHCDGWRSGWWFAGLASDLAKSPTG